MNLNRLRVKEKYLYIVCRICQAFETTINKNVVLYSNYFSGRYIAFKLNGNSLHKTFKKSLMPK